MFRDARITGAEAYGPGSILDLYPQFRMPGRWHDQVLPLAQALADSQDYNWFIAVAPRTQAGAGDPSVVVASDSVESEFNVVPGSLLWGLSSASQQAAGFRFEIWDQGHANPVSISKGTNGVMSGDVVNSPLPTPSPVPYIFPRPYAVTGSGLVLVRITNLATVANRLQLGMWLAQPKGALTCRS